MDWEDHNAWMKLALLQAVQAMEAGEVPVGAIIVHQDRVIGAAFNQREQLRDPTAHAEMLALTQASAALNDWRLNECVMYVTLEPCPMCAGAIVLARLPRVVFGALDPKAGAVESLFRLLDDSRLNHRCEIISGVMREACSELLTEFFREQRRQGKK